MSKHADSSFLAGADKALLIAIATPFAYFLAFRYDSGYLEAFGVPDTLIDVSLRDLLIAAATAISLAYLYVFLDAIQTAWPEYWSSVRAFWLSALAMMLVTLRLLAAETAVWLFTLALFAILWFLFVALPSIRRKYKAKHTSASESLQSDPASDKGIVSTLLPRVFDRHSILVIMGIIVACQGAYDLGESRAQSQSSFLLHDAHDGTVCAVIRARDTELLCANFDAETRQLTGDYQVLKPEGTTLSLRDTGPIRSPSQPHPYYATRKK